MMAAFTAAGRTPSIRRAIRLMVGLVQGGLTALLSLAARHHVAPFADPGLALLLNGLIFTVSFVFLLAWGRMRTVSMVALTAAAAALAAMVALHQSHQALVATPLLAGLAVRQSLFTGLVFVLISLALAADRDRRPWPRYPQLFAAAWDLAVLLALAGLFVLLSWGVLWLMAGLFGVIGLHGLLRWLATPWVWPLLNGTGFGAAIAFSSDGERMIAEARRLVLALFGLLLPILSGLLAIFLLTLMVVPLSTLWTTHHAGLLLSAAAVLLVLLLNAVYQGGRIPSSAMRVSGRLAAIEILPLTVLAAVALSLRVHHHGWSVDRVTAAAALAILLFYGIGYAAGALAPGRWLRLIEPVNVGAAVFAVVVVAALLTPVADPARIAVASQVARLRAGLVTADRFDYAFLASESGRYGRDALAELVARPPAGDPSSVRRRIAALDAFRQGQPAPTTPEELAANITVHPAGAVLPDGLLAFWQHPGSNLPWLPCLHRRGARCDAVILPAATPGQQAVLILDENYATIPVFSRSASGWQFVGTFDLPPGCIATRSAVLTGGAALGSIPTPAIMLPSAQIGLRPPFSAKPSCSG